MDIMKLHEKTHLDVKPHQCDICEKSFTQLTNMLNHKKTHEKEPEFKCDACGAGFRKQSTLLKHLKIHTGVKAFVCDVCEKSFDLPSSLKVCNTRNRDVSYLLAQELSFEWGYAPPNIHKHMLGTTESWFSL